MQIYLKNAHEKNTVSCGRWVAVAIYARGIPWALATATFNGTPGSSWSFEQAFMPLPVTPKPYPALLSCAEASRGLPHQDVPGYLGRRIDVGTRQAVHEDRIGTEHY